MSAARPKAASAERQISPCCPEVTTRTANSSGSSRSALMTGASLIASGRVPTTMSQLSGGSLPSTAYPFGCDKDTFLTLWTTYHGFHKKYRKNYQSQLVNLC